MNLKQRLNTFYKRIGTLSGSMLLLVALDTLLWITFLAMVAIKVAVSLGLSTVTIPWVEIIAPALAATVTTTLGAIAIKRGRILR